MRINIKSRMNELGIKSITELASISGVKYRTVYHIYTGKAKGIKIDTLEKLCKALQCKPNDILN